MAVKSPSSRPRCRSGRHVWTDPLDAERCCSPEWRRMVVFSHQSDRLDPLGRVRDDVGLIHGWVPLE